MGVKATSFLLPFYRGLALLLLLACYSLYGSAQLCNGSLGDPIVNITFGSGPNPGYPSNAIGTGYAYLQTDCPNDGQYTIRNATTACFGNTWHSLTKDHTGDAQGYFMLVNASYQPSDFYVDTVRNLCANTTYEFAAWLMNVAKNYNTILPNITFQLEHPDGTVMKKINTGDIPVMGSPHWRQYGFWFSTPPGLQKVVLRITNNAPGGIGNDIALDDITFRPCGPEIMAGIAGDGDSMDICEDELGVFTLQSEVVDGYIAPFYQWQASTNNGTTWSDIPGANNLSYNAQPTAVGTYQYRLTVAEMENASIKPCRVASNRLVIGVHPLPGVEAGPDRQMIKGFPTTLSGSVKGNDITYTWSPSLYLSDPNKLAPVVDATENMLYTLIAETAFGCTNEDVVKVQVANDLYVPNAFSPNRDGINDTWRIPFLDPYLEAEVTVYNRYGQKVYHTDGAMVSWDGMYQQKPLPLGVYVYVIQIKKWQKTLKGTVTLVK
ncbi:MAG TPA: gliding motility-associated C-terminal domain-containing protein [Chitinophagaceae bacterium]